MVGERVDVAGSDSRPLRPCSTTSTVPPLSRATTGRRIAIASANTRPNGSSERRHHVDVGGGHQALDVRPAAEQADVVAELELGDRAPRARRGSAPPGDVGAGDEQPDIGELGAHLRQGLARCRPDPSPGTAGRRRRAPARRRAMPSSARVSSRPRPGCHARDVDGVEHDVDPRRGDPGVDERLPDERRDGDEDVGVVQRPAQQPAHPRVVGDVAVDDARGRG